MSENKFHMSRNGFLTKCSATKRACPLGVHYTQAQYDQLASENDARIRPSAVKHDPESYFGKAQAAYVESVQRLKRFEQANADVKEYEAALLKENGLETAYSFKTQEQVRKSLEEALLYARDVYVEEGVSYAKASFIIQDMKNSADPTKPITKRRDSMDAQIAVKTKTAKERLNEDPKYEALANSYSDAVRNDHVAGDVSRKVALYRTNLIRNNNANGMSNLAEQKDLERAKIWLKAGLPPSSKEVPTSTISPENVSIDNKGRINNVWIEGAKGIERVVGYRAPKHERSSGALITESGTEVATYTHYHSYKAEYGGVKNVIIADKNGVSYPASKFELHMSWDSGD